MSASESTQSTMRPLYQVKWFSKKKGFGFVKDTAGEDIFVHHSDITVDGFRYLREGEVVSGVEEMMDNGRRSPRFHLQWMEGVSCAKSSLLGDVCVALRLNLQTNLCPLSLMRLLWFLSNYLLASSKILS